MGGTSPWMTTFADLCTLLLVFFVMILSMSSLNEKAFRSTFLSAGEGSGAMREAPAELDEEFGVDEAKRDVQNAFGDRGVTFIEDDAATGAPLLSRVDSGNEADVVIHIRKDVRKDAFTFVIQESLLFDATKGAIGGDGRLMLSAIGEFAKDSGQQVVVDHFEGVNAQSGGVAVRESEARRKALTILDYLVGEAGVEPRRLCAGGYGTTVDGTAPGGRGVSPGIGRTEITFENRP